MSMQPGKETFAQKIYYAYPDQDMLPIKPPDSGETIAEFTERVREAKTDGLFQFLCDEANDDWETEGIDEYINRLDRAILDIEAVRAAFTAGT